MRRGLLLWAPLGLFILLAVGLIFGLRKPEGSTITSKLIGAPMPAFALPPATAGMPGLASTDLATGQPHLVNIFASWCVPCGVEAPQLRAIADAGVPIVGIAIRDRPEDLTAFLRRNGNPFARIGGDATSSVQIALGSSGVPESFVIDGQGRIRLQHIGEIAPGEVAGIVAAGGGGAMRHALATVALLLAAPALAQSSMPAAAYADTQLPDPAQEARARALMETIRCLVCQGQAISDSNAEMAGDMRSLIRQRIAAGERPEAIRAWLIQRYGNWVSYAPPLDRVTGLLWIAPIVLLGAGLAIARGSLRRRRR